MNAVLQFAAKTVFQRQHAPNIDLLRQQVAQRAPARYIP
jgi:hypothetical protein